MPKAWASSELNRHVATNVDPQILVVDEALSVGDERFQRKCFSRIETIENDGATILFVSHFGSAVVELCDGAMLLDSGEELAIGTPKIIVGKYQRLLYAADDKRSAIREGIRSSTSSVNLPERIIQPCLEAKASSNEGLPGDSESEEFFDPSLVPQSTLAYESQGAQIESPQIRTLAGDKVNCLKRGRTYRYTYKVRFDRGANNVRFGVLIKTTTGIELGGAVSAPSASHAVPYFASGSLVLVEFRITCALNPGTYFLNAGVLGSTDKEESFLHRVLDACISKVVSFTGEYPLVRLILTGYRKSWSLLT